MRFVRNCLGAIFASMALVAVPGQAAENNYNTFKCHYAEELDFNRKEG